MFVNLNYFWSRLKASLISGSGLLQLGLWLLLQDCRYHELPSLPSSRIHRVERVHGHTVFEGVFHSLFGVVAENRVALCNLWVHGVLWRELAHAEVVDDMVLAGIVE